VKSLHAPCDTWDKPLRAVPRVAIGVLHCIFVQFVEQAVRSGIPACTVKEIKGCLASVPRV
jgi:hypothetical protein